MSLSELLFGGWGDAFSDVMTLGTEMVSTATERVKTGIADFFEDPVATARQATMETTERIANAGGARQYFEKPGGPDLGVAEPGDVELGVIKATKNTITEILHDLPEIGGKGLVGTYDMNNVDDLQEILGKIKKNHAWEDVTQSTAKVDVDARLSRWENKEFGGRGSEAIELQEFKPPTVKELAKDFKADGMSGKSAVKAARVEQEELIDANAAGRRLFPRSGDGPINLVDAILGPGPMRDMIDNFSAVGWMFLRRMRREAADSGPDERLQELLERADAYMKDVPVDVESPGAELAI